MIKWEYKVIVDLPYGLTVDLNQEGAQGWEVAGVMPPRRHVSPKIILKRRYNDDKQ